MFLRREFLRTLGVLGLSGAVFEKRLLAKTASLAGPDGGPLVMCSRGEDWGRKVLEPAWSTWKETQQILDALEVGANVCELDPSDQSVGYGGLPDERGVVALDASVMYGPTHKCGSVASMENIKKACSVARLVMERTDHQLIVGAGALAFAKAHGFPEENLLTEASRIAWLRWKENLSEHDDWLPPADGNYERKRRTTGTINVLGMGANGEVAGITTTSGMFGKIHGRVGDSPIIGAGLYVDNEVGAAGATGRGEELLRTCGSFLLVEKMRAGLSAQQACEAVIDRLFHVNGGRKNCSFNVKMVAFSKNGDIGCASIEPEDQEAPYATVMTDAGLRVVKGKAMK